MFSVILAFFAGALTLLNPCVLPLLPIIIGAAFQENRLGPAAVAAGLTLSFSAIGVFILVFGFSLGVDTATVRLGGAALMILFGLVLLIPALHASIVAIASPVTSSAGGLTAKISATGISGQFAIGLLLGIVWSPCAGPTLGTAIASASQGKDIVESFFIFGFFALGVSTALLSFAYASRATLAGKKLGLQRLSKWAKPLFGLLLLAVGTMIFTGLDKNLEASLLGFMPEWLIQLTTGF